MNLAPYPIAQLDINEELLLTDFKPETSGIFYISILFFLAKIFIVVKLFYSSKCLSFVKVIEKCVLYI